MKKKIILVSFILIGSFFVNAQQIGTVGINTTDPKATLDVQAISSNTTAPEGIIAPRLTLAQLIAKNTQYGANQKGAIVYVVDVTGTPADKTINITTTGYYYFDGDVWQSIGGKVYVPSEPWLVQGGSTEATSNLENIFQTGKVAIGLSEGGPNQLAVKGASNLDGTVNINDVATLAKTINVKGASTLEGETRIGSTSDVASRVTITQGGKIGSGTDTPTAQISLVGNSSTTPIFNLIDNSTTANPLGKVLSSDVYGNGTWQTAGTSMAIMGTLEYNETDNAGSGRTGFRYSSTIKNRDGVKTAYAGMYIDLPVGSYQINFSVWLTPSVTGTGSRRFASVFFSKSNVYDGYTNISTGNPDPAFPTITDGTQFKPQYTTSIESTLIGPTYASGESDFAGSGAIPVTITENDANIFKRIAKDTDPNESRNWRVRMYLWVYLSPNSSTTGTNLYSRTLAPGYFGPYVQLYALSFTPSGQSDSVAP